MRRLLGMGRVDGFVLRVRTFAGKIVGSRLASVDRIGRRGLCERGSTFHVKRLGNKLVSDLFDNGVVFLHNGRDGRSLGNMPLLVAW